MRHVHNPLFIGREPILEELDIFFTSLSPDPLRIIALTGMPGVGKTEIVLEYVYRCSYKNYQVVIWLNAFSRNHLADDIVKLLSTFGMNLSWKSVEERERIFKIFREWLWHQPRFLLVLDAIQDDSLIQILEDGMIGHVVLTKASLRNIEYFQEIRVESFDEQESSLFLLRRAGLLALNKPLSHVSRKVRQAASAIHKEFGGLPLALDQAGAYISETSADLVDYLPLYRKNIRAFLDRRGANPPSHPFSAYAVISAMRQGAAYNAQELLFLYVQDLINCSDASPQIPSTLRVSSQLRQASDSKLFQMRATLIENFLLVLLDYGKWDMHPLVRTVMLEVMAYEREQARLRRAKEDEYAPLNEEEIFQMLVQVQQMKRQATEQLNDFERLDLVRDITIPVNRLKRAVLPAPRRQRDQAKKRIEDRYSALVHSSNAPLSTASQNDIRHYARELLALMQYR